jgi:hypothetical protein
MTHTSIGERPAESDERSRELARLLTTAGNALTICGLISLVASAWFIVNEWTYMQDNPGAELAPVLVVGGLGIFSLAVGATIGGIALGTAGRTIGNNSSGR